MEYAFIESKVVEVYEKCRVRNYPIDCLHLLEKYGLRHMKYSDASKKKQDMYKSYSEDAFKYHHIICYNDSRNEHRIRFTLMHELGHHVLSHGNEHGDKQESEANAFAGLVLAPTLVIHYARVRTKKEISEFFNISLEASQYALQRYERWFRNIALSQKVSWEDKQLYDHFYSPAHKQFIYKRQRCLRCGKELINTPAHYCPACESHLTSPARSKVRNDFQLAEDQWLYGDLY